MNFHKVQAQGTSIIQNYGQLLLSLLTAICPGERESGEAHRDFPPKNTDFKLSKRILAKVFILLWIDFNIPLCEVIFSFVAIAMLQGRKREAHQLMFKTIVHGFIVHIKMNRKPRWMTPALKSTREGTWKKKIISQVIFPLFFFWMITLSPMLSSDIFLDKAVNHFSCFVFFFKFKVTNEIRQLTNHTLQKLLKMVLKGASYQNIFNQEKLFEREVGNYNYKNRTKCVRYHKIFIHNQPLIYEKIIFQNSIGEPTR